VIRRPRHIEWVLPVVIFLAALSFQLRGEVAVQRQRPWQPAASSAESLGRFEHDVDLAYDPQSFALTEEDAVREIVLSGSDMPSAMALDVADTIAREARALGYDPFLALAIMHVESNFHFEAVSQRGAEGLMQVMPKTQQWLLAVDPALTHVAERADPTLNVRLGMRYFGQLQRSFGRTDWALQAYNCGPGCLIESLHSQRSLPQETAVYAQKVLHRYDHFRSQYGYLTPYKSAQHVIAKHRALASGPRPLSP
jgi:soluble lytic murein transglycosylase-like protein